jgi:hypothetical protein
MKSVRLHRARVLGLAAAAPLLAAALLPAPANASTSAPRCHASALTARLGPGEGAAGHVYVPILFKNASTQRCSLTGHPGVSFVAGDDGHQVGRSADRDLGSVPRVIDLEPGQRAAAQLRITLPGSYPEQDCRPVWVRGLRVYPPGSTAAMYIKVGQTACSSSDLHNLNVRSVRGDS